MDFINSPRSAPMDEDQYTHELHQAKYSFTKSDLDKLPSSRDIITFSKGDIIKVLRKVDEDWWYGCSLPTGHVGYLPAKYLKTFNHAAGADCPCRFDDQYICQHAELKAKDNAELISAPQHLIPSLTTKRRSSYGGSASASNASQTDELQQVFINGIGAHNRKISVNARINSTPEQPAEISSPSNGAGTTDKFFEDPSTAAALLQPHQITVGHNQLVREMKFTQKSGFPGLRQRSEFSQMHEKIAKQNLARTSSGESNDMSSLSQAHLADSLRKKLMQQSSKLQQYEIEVSRLSQEEMKKPEFLKIKLRPICNTLESREGDSHLT